MLGPSAVLESSPASVRSSPSKREQDEDDLQGYKWLAHLERSPSGNNSRRRSNDMNGARQESVSRSPPRAASSSGFFDANGALGQFWGRRGSAGGAGAEEVPAAQAVQTDAGVPLLGQRPTAALVAAEAAAATPAGARRTPQEPRRPLRPRRVRLGTRPELLLTYATEFPDCLKLRKRVFAGPLEFVLRASWRRRTRAIECGCACRDRLLGGVVSLDLPTRQLHYKVRVPAGSARVALSASCSYAGLLDGRTAANPTIGFQYELGGGSAVSWAGSQFDVQQEVRLTRGLRLEVCGNVEIPTPAARYSLEGQQGVVDVGAGHFHVHVAELNPVLEL